MTGVGAVIGSFMKEPEDAGPNDAFYYGTSAIEGLAAGAMLVVISNAMCVCPAPASPPVQTHLLILTVLALSSGCQRLSDKEAACLASLYYAGTRPCSSPSTRTRVNSISIPLYSDSWPPSSWSSPTSGDRACTRLSPGPYFHIHNTSTTHRSAPSSLSRSDSLSASLTCSQEEMIVEMIGFLVFSSATRDRCVAI
jgi:hypothetical protein